MISIVYGLPGAGKTYYTLKRIVLPALAEGRRVLHNIAGFQMDGAHRHNSRFQDFLPTAKVDGDTSDVAFDWKKGEGALEGGDLLIVDEVGLIADGDAVRKADWDMLLRFFAIHRHATGKDRIGEVISTDVVLICQDDSQVPVALRKKIERTILCRDPRMFGKVNNRDALIFWGSRTVHAAVYSEADRVDRYVLEPSFFKLYHSYAGGGVARESMRRRRPFFTLKVSAALAAVAGSFGLLGWSTWNFYDFWFAGDDISLAVEIDAVGSDAVNASTFDDCGVSVWGQCLRSR